MEFGLSEELVMLRDMVRGFASGKIAPYADEWDEKHYFPYAEVVKPMGELGLFGTVIPEEYGGNNMGWLAAAIITEEIARASSSLRVQVNMQEIGCAYTILRYGTEEQKKKYIQKLVNAEILGAFAITEPQAGSDVMAIKSLAVDKGDHWLLNGTKTWISNATVGGINIYYAYTEKEGKKALLGLHPGAGQVQRDHGDGPGQDGIALIAHRGDHPGGHESSEGEHPGEAR